MNKIFLGQVFGLAAAYALFGWLGLLSALEFNSPVTRGDRAEPKE
jgi:hypothetical protein